MRKLWIVALIGSVGLVGGCEAMRTAPDDSPVEEPEQTPEEEVISWITDIQELRQREFSETVGVRQGEPSELGRSAVPESVSQEWDWLSRTLFGGGQVELILDDPEWAQMAAFDAEAKELVFSGDPRTDSTSAFAVSMATNLALEELAFGSMESVETVDQWLSREIARRAGPAFVTAASSAQRTGLGLSVDDLAERPELSIHIPGVGERLAAMVSEADMIAAMQENEGSDHFEEALQQLVMRKSVALGSALYRAGGWPAVEWGQGEPPMQTQYIVRPDKWFEGSGTVQWTWPEEFDEYRDNDSWTEVQTGQVGPALTSIWLEALVGPRAARTIYSGWLADSYRIFTRGDGEEEEVVFNWVTAWETPHDAQEIGAAAEAVLGHYIGSEHRDNRFRVAVQGVNVAITIYDTDQDSELLDREVEVLSEARAGFLPDEEAPFTFLPTLLERYVTVAEEATLDLDQAKWIDPAAGWKADLGSLDAWNVQRSDESHVRWFANHTDGTLIQWTTEVLDPLEAEFGSPEYLDKIGDAFGQTVSAKDAPDIAMSDDPVDPTIEVEVIGLIDGRPLVLHLWQWRRGDVLVSFSIQGSEHNFGERLVEAEAVLKTLERYGEPVEGVDTSAQMDPADDAGIIEFRVEEEEAEE